MMNPRLQPANTAAPPTATRRTRLRRDERRRMIIDTTLLCLARDGTEGASLRSVCRELGVAPSLVTHFFSSWRDLLDAAYRTLVERLSERLTQVVEADYPTARERMDAVIAVYLSTSWVKENSIGASIAFWQLSRNMPELRAPFGDYLVERSRLLRRALAALVEEAGSSVDIDELTEGLILMLDGVWLEISLNPGGLDEARTQRLCWFWLDLALGRR